MKWLTALLLVATPITALAGEREALTSVVAHLASQDDSLRSFWRFVWLQPGSGVTPTQIDLAANIAMGNTAQIVSGTPISEEVIAYFLPDFDPAQPERLISVWDSLATQDPIFHVVKEVQEGEPTPILAPHLAAVIVTDVTGEASERLDVIATQMSSSSAPILEARFLLDEWLDGSYYAFRNIKIGDDLNQLLARRGFFFGSSKELNGIRANLMLRSRITGDQRVIAAIPGTVGGVATITYDLFDETTSPDRQFTRNLSNFNKIEDGSEVFIPLPNGLLEFLLANAEGKVVDTAPPNLASDSTKPPGHDHQLRPALSCISCHTLGDGEGMYRGIDNQFNLLPLPAGDFLETSRLRDTFSTPLDTADGFLGRARRDYSVAVSGFTGGEEGALNILHQEIVQTIFQYRYRMLSPKDQVRELGLPEGSDLKTKIQLDPSEIIDPEIALAISGVELSRKNWNVIRVQLAARLVLGNSE